ncbi:MAG: FKBP-type peptidyl-prolyl cis-trans isomerase [Chitinophagaceae bacterium]
MKKTFIGILLFTAFGAVAQKKQTPAKKPVAKTTVAPSSILKTVSDSASYAIGVSVANFYAQQGISKLNPSLVAKAINDVMVAKKPLMDEMQCNTVMMKYMNSAQEAKAGPNIAAGEAFLAKNKNKPGVKTTPSGLQYEVVVKGSGPMPTATDSVTCHYKGTLIDGTEFDNSYSRGEPITFPVSGVIKGWTEALQLMPAGSKYKLYIPQQLAYGPNEIGNIPAGSVLLFDVELLKVNGK